MSDNGWTTVTHKKRKKNKKKKSTPPDEIIIKLNESDIPKKSTTAYCIPCCYRKPTEEILSDEGVMHIDLISKNVSARIRDIRTTKNLTQKELANACNLPLKVIQDYEAGTAVPNPIYSNKIARVLKISLKD